VSLAQSRLMLGEILLEHNSESAENVAQSWMEMTRLKGDCPDDIFERGFHLNILALDEPYKAWEAIRLIINSIDHTSLLKEGDNDSKYLAANLGSGPLETLLSEHGKEFIGTIEDSASRDDRMVWILGCVWKNAMTDEIWIRIQRAAGGMSR